MQRLKIFATAHPYLFSFLMFPVIPYALFGISTGLHSWFGTGMPSALTYQIEAKIGSLLIYLVILWGFGWLRASGFGSTGRWSVWGIMIVAALYELTLLIYTITGEFEISYFTRVADPPRYLLTGLMEETLFRGVVLFTFIRLWGASKGGVIKSVLISSLWFGLPHLTTVMTGNPLSGAIFQALSSAAGGIFYAGILLFGGSIWIPIFSHAVVDAIGHGNFHAVAVLDFAQANYSYLLINVPLAILGLYLTLKAPPHPVDSAEAGPQVVAGTLQSLAQ